MNHLWRIVIVISLLIAICPYNTMGTTHTIYIIEHDTDLNQLDYRGSGSVEDPYIIEDLDGNFFLEIESFSKYLTIQNNIFRGDNEESFNYRISIVSSSNIVIKNNYFENVGNGIFSQSSSDILITGNVIKTTSTGLELLKNSKFSITSNLISGSTSTGIILDQSQGLINNNEIRGYSKGISVVNATSTITNNDLTESTDIGMIINSDSLNNRVYWNNFIENKVITANDDGINNTFEGNYWSDWTDPDENQDGIVDNSYVIDGISANEDTKPRVDLNIVNLEVPQEYIQDGSDTQIPMIIAIIVILILMLTIIFNYIRNKLLKLKLDELGEWVVISTLGTVPPALVNIINSDWSDTDEKFEFEVPQELYEFKKLLHPVRLSILTTLFEDKTFVSSELRKYLDIPWGVYTHGISTLVEMGYIREDNEFVQENLVKVISISLEGEEVYLQLKSILTRLFRM